MTLDIHRSDDKFEYLYGLNDQQLNCLSDIFDQFYRETGILIDEYKDLGLSVDNQKHMVKVIEKYITEMDLNKNRKQVLEILSFRGFLLFTINKNWNLMLFAD